MKKYFSMVILTLLVGFGGAVIYSFKLNPEVGFWQTAIKRKIEDLEALDRRKPVYLFIGGSSCAFSVDPEQLGSEFDLQAINLGLHAGAGRPIQTELALQHIRAGDVVVVAFETTFWRDQDPFKATSLGSQLYFCCHDLFKLPIGIKEIGIDPQWKVSDLRPGGYHLATTSLKLAFGRTGYRYGVNDLRRGGLITYSQGLIEASASRGDFRSEMSEASRSFLQGLINFCVPREVKVLVSLPWEYVAEDVLDKQRQANVMIGEHIAKLCPLLEDPAMGACSEAAYFSDTLWHLNPEGVEIRTRRIGKAIKKWQEQIEL